MGETVGFVGVSGGAGTTRTCVEMAATLARDGREVAVIDAAFGTQGLSTYVEGRIEPDLTSVLLDERAVTEAFVDCWPALEGRCAIAPAHAPFGRLARAKTAEAARGLEAAIDRAAGAFDHVLVDVPPLAANQSVAAATAVDHRVLVAPATRRGADLLPRMRGRLGDVGVPAEQVLVTRASSEDPADTPLTGADAVIPAGPVDADAPTVIDPDGAFAPAIARAAETIFECTLDLEFEDESRLFGRSN